MILSIVNLKKIFILFFFNFTIDNVILVIKKWLLKNDV